MNCTAHYLTYDKNRQINLTALVFINGWQKYAFRECLFHWPIWCGQFDYKAQEDRTCIVTTNMIAAWCWRQFIFYLFFFFMNCFHSNFAYVTLFKRTRYPCYWWELLLTLWYNMYELCRNDGKNDFILWEELIIGF